MISPSLKKIRDSLNGSDLNTSSGTFRYAGPIRMCHALDLNLGLNEYREEWDKAVKQHAVVAVTYLSRYHPAFRQLDVSKVFCLIYRFASMPSVPDTGPVPTLRQLWADDKARTQRAKRRSVVAYYDRVVPGVKFL